MSALIYYATMALIAVLVVRGRGTNVAWAHAAWAVTILWGVYAVFALIGGSAFFLVPLFLAVVWLGVGFATREREGRGVAVFAWAFAVLVASFEWVLLVFACVGFGFVLTAWLRARYAWWMSRKK